MGDGIEPVTFDRASVNEQLTRQSIDISDQQPKLETFFLALIQHTLGCTSSRALLVKH